MNKEPRWLVGEGWWPILDELHAKILAIEPAYNLLQHKEKFGGLRYYIDLPRDEDAKTTTSEEDAKRIWDLIREAEGKADITCEDCGAPGKSRDNGWIRTLCDECQAAFIESRNNRRARFTVTEVDDADSN